MNKESPRDTVELAVRRELFGPEAEEERRGTPLDCSATSVTLPFNDSISGTYYDSKTGEEILLYTNPLHRYGVGVLYPNIIDNSSQQNDSTSEDFSVEETPIPGLPTSIDDDTEVDSHSDITNYQQESSTTRIDAIDSTDDFDLTDANKFKPSAIAISYQCHVLPSTVLELRISGAYYDQLDVKTADTAKQIKSCWIRRPFILTGRIDSSMLRSDRQLSDIDLMPNNRPQPRVRVRAQLYTRRPPNSVDDTHRLVTIAVRNCMESMKIDNVLFQMSFTVKSFESNVFEPYYERENPIGNEEDQSIDFLYRKRYTYAIGHGCAATWDDHTNVTVITADPMPTYEVGNLTPNIKTPDKDGNCTSKILNISMRELALGSDVGRQEVERLLELYENWIHDRENEISDLDEKYRAVAERHMRLCRNTLERMRTGWYMVSQHRHSSPAKAFRWMNEAMLYQQLRSKQDIRKLVCSSSGTWRPQEAYTDFKPLDTLNIPNGLGSWRPFQIAFILTVIPDLIDRHSSDRSMVDLIFFPTGGGKTEAYLGVSAFSLLMRRLRNPDDQGTDTLMRYTLRLLTIQQFQRAATLICVLEDIRSRNQNLLGTSRFGIGAWVGGTSTPNTWKNAVEALDFLHRGRKEENPFLVLRCPWCGAQLGPQQRPGSRGKETCTVGYDKYKENRMYKIRFICPDPCCRYNSPQEPLPIHVVDEDIYESRPSLIIGTVDKFAMLPWRPEARAIFGLDDNGDQLFSPPGLIIQDEIHLISGPLGSMAGLYEPIVDDLCTDKRDNGGYIVPKIIASTATARRYGEQILALFGRREDQVAIFPPHGLEEGHSFFAEPEVDDAGNPTPGRKYLGVFSASLGSTQTVQVRVAASTLEAPMSIPSNKRDGYWTNLNFFNSLRELGNTVTLLQSDVPDYVRGLQKQRSSDLTRPLRKYIELTSRRSNDEIPKAIEELETRYDDDKKNCIDICLASNIVEVGIDIDRLALMTVVGQPKTTAQYIQVSGRVGRKPQVAPGLVITIYGAAKPRDRSHFERFQTYHERLYAEVEPTSVTPFARPVLKRALPAAIIAYIRQAYPKSTEPDPFPLEAFDKAASILRKRAMIVEPSALHDLDEEVNYRRKNWSAGERTVWSANTVGGDQNQGLMRQAGSCPTLSNTSLVWDIPMSMRNVDAQCKIQISQDYCQEDSPTFTTIGEEQR